MGRAWEEGIGVSVQLNTPRPNRPHRFFHKKASRLPDNPYKQPILAFILRVFATIPAAIAIATLGVIIVGVASGNGTAGVLLSLPVLISAAVSVLLLLGLAQVIDYLGRTAHASEEAANGAQDSADLLRQLLRSYGHEPEA
jgi:hypothetical protein